MVAYNEAPACETTVFIIKMIYCYVPLFFVWTRQPGPNIELCNAVCLISDLRCGSWLIGCMIISMAVQILYYVAVITDTTLLHITSDVQINFCVWESRSL